MKSFFKTLALAGSTLILSYAALEKYQQSIVERIVEKQNQSLLTDYVAQNLSSFIRTQEQELNITHFGKPTVKRGIPEEHKKKYPRLMLCGSYDPDENIIYLLSDIDLEEDKDGLEVISSNNQSNNPCKIKEILNHELGHFYADKLSESLGRGSWPLINDEKTKSENISLPIINEGIAEYFEKPVNDKKDYFKDSEWPSTIAGFFNSQNQDIPNYHLRYEGGYHLVKPIIDLFGQKGIKYLMFHPPNKEDLLDLPGYQQKVLQVLWRENIYNTF